MEHLVFKGKCRELHSCDLEGVTLQEVQAKQEDLSREHKVEKGEIEVTIEDRGEWILRLRHNLLSSQI